jgi:sec-independent protein translocase protein TatA
MHQLTNNILAMWAPGPIEILVILVIAILIFGKRLPEIARGMGKSLHEFKKGVKEAKDVEEDIENDVKDAVGLNEREGKSVSN